MKTICLAVLLLAACGSDSNNSGIDAPGGESGSGSGTLDCASYCTKITANCTGANNQYGSMATCVASCAHFPVGAISDLSGNTLGCRLYHAGAAAADPGTHCIHAGPSGGTVCGQPCDGFCSLVTAECATQYPSAGTCATQCANYATTPLYSAAVTSGNSLSCRIYHATAASTDPTTHCPHTGSNGGGVCQ
jgi:hypothetical protein